MLISKPLILELLHLHQDSIAHQDMLSMKINQKTGGLKLDRVQDLCTAVSYIGSNFFLVLLPILGTHSSNISCVLQGKLSGNADMYMYVVKSCTYVY